MSRVLNRWVPCAAILVLATASDSRAGWTTGALSAPRQSVGAVSVGGKAIFAGGRNGSVKSDVVDVYDEATDTWTKLTLSQPRTHIAATVVGPYALFAGGAVTNSTSTARVDVLDTQTMTWLPTVALSQARWAAAATTVGTKAIFAGGNSAGLFNPSPSIVIDIYDASLGTPHNPIAWSTKTLSLSRALMTAVTAGNQAIFAGGVSAGAFGDSTVDIYDDSTGAWTATALSQGRLIGAAGGCSVGPYAYFFGGQVSSVPFVLSDVVDIYDTQTGAWTNMNLSGPRGGVAAVALDDTIVVAGGAVDAGGVAVTTDLVEVLDAGTSTFGPPMQLSLARVDPAGVAVGGKAVFAGGNLGGGAGTTTRVDVYTPTWIDLGEGKAGVLGVPQLEGSGTLVGGTPVTLALSDAPANTTAHLIVGFTALNAPFQDGLLVPNTNVVIPGLPTDGSGALILGANWPVGLPPGFEVFFQVLVTDPIATFNLSQSNAVQGTTP